MAWGGSGSKRAAENRLGSLLARLARGVILVDSLGRVVGSNAYAQRVLDDEDGLKVEEGRLRTVAREGRVRSLATMIQQAARSAGPPSRSGAVRLPRASGRPLEVVVLSLGDEIAAEAPDEAVAAVLVTDPERSGVSVELLRELYGLTRTESEIAADLSAGWSPDEIAGRRGVQPNTVRVHLKAVFTKTGTSRQAELVQRILTSPLGALGPEDSEDSED